MLRYLTYLSIALASICPVAWAAQPLTQVGRGTTPIVDGHLTDAGWRDCAQLFPFIEAEGSGLAKPQTKVLVFYSDAALHLAFRCEEPNVGGLGTFCKKRDDGVWRDDCVEVFIQRPGQKGWFHIIVNSLGTTYDAKNRSPQWNPKLAVKAFKEKVAWGIELSIPWADLGGAPKVGESWRVNFCRERKVENELSCWSCTYGKFLKPERFGEIVFAESALRLEEIEITDAVPGANRAQLRLEVPAQATAQVKARNGEAIHTRPGGGLVELVYPVGLSADEIVFSAQIGDQVVWRAAVPTDVRPRPQLATLNAAIEGLRKVQDTLPKETPLAASLASTLSRAQEAGDALQAAIERSLADGKPLGMGSYEKLNSAVAAEARNLSRMSWPVWTKNNWLDLGRTEMPASIESISELSFTSLVNEYESGNVIITNLGDKALRLRITTSDFEWQTSLAGSEPNLLKNAGVDENSNSDNIPDGWVHGGGSRRAYHLAEEPERGRVIAVERPTAGKQFTLRQTLNLEAGQRYTLQFWARAEGATPNVQAHVINKGWTYASGSRPIGGTHGWRRVQFSFTPPASRLHQLVVRDSGGGTGNVYLDDFVLVKGTTQSSRFGGVRPQLLVADWQELRGGKAVADPLIPLNRAGRLDVPPGESRQVWITLPPRDLPPGQYECSLVAKPLAQAALKGSPPAKSVTIRLDVKPLRISTSPSFSVYNWDYARDEVYVQDLYDHKVNFYLINTHMPSPGFDTKGNPTGAIDYSRYDHLLRTKIKYAREAGGQILFAYGIIRDFHRSMSKKHGWQFRDEAWDRAFRCVYSQWLSHLKALGLSYDEYCVQVWDEATGAHIHHVVEGGKLLREIDPEVRLAMDGAQSLEEVKRIDPYIDVWIPHLTTLLSRDPNGELLKYYKQTGEPVYTYTCSTFMKALSPYTYHRLKPWQAARLGLEGVFYWAYNSWRGDPWNDFDGSIADCGVIYPAAHGRPITSRRWEASREGIEDWQVIRLLQALAKEGNVAPTLIDDTIESVLTEPAEVERAQVARLKLIDAAIEMAKAAPLEIANLAVKTDLRQEEFLGRQTQRPCRSVTFETNRPANGCFLYRLKGLDDWQRLDLTGAKTSHTAQVALPPEADAEWLVIAWDGLGRVAFARQRSGGHEQ